MKIGVNLEYVRHADKSLAYGVKPPARWATSTSSPAS